MKMLDAMPSNGNGQSLLNRLKTFRLIIHSILTFQFDHLVQILQRILNDQTSSSFSLILQNALARNDESMKLINGQQWQRLLQFYPRLMQLKLFIQISEWMDEKEEFMHLKSFDSTYFQQRNWTFAYWKYPIRKQMAFYSIPYQNKNVLEIAINADTLSKNLPANNAKFLSIDQIDTSAYPLTFNYLEKSFPFLEELNINHIHSFSSVISSLNLPSLHTLKIAKLSVHLPDLFRLFPSINTLSLYFNPPDRPLPSK